MFFIIVTLCYFTFFCYSFVTHFAIEKAVIGGMGIGLFPTFLALENKDLQQVMPIIDGWRSDLWVVTHVDLHRTAKVKACFDLIRKQAQLILSRNS